MMRRDAVPLEALGACVHPRRPPDRGRRVFAPAPRPTAARAAGFTMMEVVLAVSLVVLLMALTAGSLYGTLESTRVRTNSSRMASLLRAARAEAANTGRRMRLSFDAETGQPVVTIEPEPLEEAGVFQPFDAWWVASAQLQGGVRVARCELTGGSAFLELQASQTGLTRDDDSGLRPVTFYPDGTSDSARIVLASDDEDRPWAVEITLNGVDGTIDIRQIDTEEEPIE